MRASSWRTVKDNEDVSELRDKREGVTDHVLVLLYCSELSYEVESGSGSKLKVKVEAGHSSRSSFSSPRLFVERKAGRSRSGHAGEFTERALELVSPPTSSLHFSSLISPSLPPNSFTPAGTSQNPFRMCRAHTVVAYAISVSTSSLLHAADALPSLEPTLPFFELLAVRVCEGRPDAKNGERELVVKLRMRRSEAEARLAPRSFPASSTFS
jgi:hypothetical protein